jgi:putative addiction module component (TIGR02574 family)
MIVEESAMSAANLDRLRTEAMQLSDAERADLADLLWVSVTDQSVLDAAWNKELEQRVANLDAKLTIAIPAEDVMAEARKIITLHRK